MLTISCLFTISYLFTISCLFTFDRFSYVSIHLWTISSVNFCLGTFLFVNYGNCFWRRRRILMVRPAREPWLAGKKCYFRVSFLFKQTCGRGKFSSNICRRRETFDELIWRVLYHSQSKYFELISKYLSSYCVWISGIFHRSLACLLPL